MKTDPDSTPSANGSNGRDTRGRFAKGNQGGPGNPHAKRTAQLRTMLLDCVADDDLKTVVAKLLALAKGGDLGAIRELLDRLLGKAAATVDAQIKTNNTPIEFHDMTPEEADVMSRLLTRNRSFDR